MLSSGGQISKGAIHGLGASQSMSPVSITGASPMLSDVLLDNANGGVDMVVVNGGTSSPQFDHMDIAQSHCAFHFNAGTGIKITNSNVHGNAYALMVEASAGTVVSGSNLYANASVNIGACSGGSVSASGNYYSGITAAFDGSCSTMQNTNPVSSMISTAGVRP